MVTVKHRASAEVSPHTGLTPTVTFTSPSGSSAGPWYVTTAHERGRTTEDTIVVYSDKGAPESVRITEHDTYMNLFSDDPDNPNRISATITSAHASLITSPSSRFPTGGRKVYIERTLDNDDNDSLDSDTTVSISGRFDGVFGDFQCTSTAAAEDDVCSVRHLGVGAGYVLADGTWTFRTSETSTVKVPDAEYMYFGWWRRKTDGAFAYRTFSVTRGLGSDTGFDALGGSATYEGPAIGQYAIYQPLGTQSNHGEFKATARLTANFDRNRLSGTVSGFDVSGFDVSPGWSLTLNETDISTVGQVSDGTVSWNIDGNVRDGGGWSGTFHSELESYEGHIPDGLTGEFNAQYGDDADSVVARIRGAYGAHVKP